MHYTERLRALREDHDLKQWQVAQVLGVQHNTYSQYENGIRPLPVYSLITLCRYYRVTSDYILGLSDNPYEEGRHR
ncbi:MAG: transcriptional regulator [Clostridiales bacterium]|nr:MAG: transcriptional regulator [Clostridiales bacterium]